MEGQKQKRKRTRRMLARFLGAVFFALFVFTASGASAASLYFSPSSGNFSVGNIFTVSALVNTGGTAINNAEGTINFPPSLLEIVSVSKSGSIFSLWVEGPSFSNSVGKISFNGGLPTPGFNGSAGRILSIVFRVKAPGAATVAFSSGAVRANDGYGTNVLTSTSQAQFSLILEEEPFPPPAPAPSPGSPPSAPIVTSAVFKDENQWYSDSNLSFEWQLPSDVTGVSLMLTDSPDSNPGPLSDGLMESHTIENVVDGIWYFHIKFRNQYGWGAITHRKVLVDTKDPEPFKSRLRGTEDPTNPSPTVHFVTTDELSGVAYYEVKVDGQEKRIPPAPGSEENSYILPPQPPGYHSIIVTAYDGAENSTRAVSEVTIREIAPPVISDYSRDLTAGDILNVSGTFSPNGTVRIYLEKVGEDPISNEVEVDRDGNWQYRHELPLARGDYLLWAEGIDKRGAQSGPTDKINFVVKLPALLRIGQLAIDYLSIVLSLLALIILIILIVAYAWYRINLWRRKLRSEVREAEESVQKAFDALYEDIRDNLEELENVRTAGELSRKEKKLLKNMKGALDVAERYIGKEMQDVEKELE